MSYSRIENSADYLAYQVAINFPESREEIQKIRDAVDEIHSRVTRFIDEHLPDRIKAVAVRIYNVMPEILFSACVMTGVASPLCLMFWWGRLTLLSMPFIGNFIEGKISFEDIKNVLNDPESISYSYNPCARAIRDIIENFHWQFDQFRTALAVCFTVYGTGSYLSSFLTMNLSHMLQGTLYSIAGQILFRQDEITMYFEGLGAGAASFFRNMLGLQSRV